MDLAGAIWLIGLAGGAEEDQAFVADQALRLYGGQLPDIEHWLDVYRRYYAIYYAPDPAVYPYSMAALGS
jgi:hypothetical protein